MNDFLKVGSEENHAGLSFKSWVHSADLRSERKRQKECASHGADNDLTLPNLAKENQEQPEEEENRTTGRKGFFRWRFDSSTSTLQKEEEVGGKTCHEQKLSVIHKVPVFILKRQSQAHSVTGSEARGINIKSLSGQK